MTGEINRVPRALLSLLDMKARGQNPRSLANELDASIDVLPLYLQDQRRDISVDVTVNAIGVYSGAALFVPQNQLWWVHGLSCIGPIAGLAAGTTVAGRMMIEGPTTPANRKIVGFWDEFGPGYIAGWHTDPTPLIVTPGSALTFLCIRVVLGAAPLCTITADVTVLEI